MTKKFFTERQAGISAVVAGPIPAGILIYLNYKALGKDREAILSLAFTLFFSTVLFYVLFALPAETIDNIPSFFFTTFYALIVYLFFQKFMSADIKRELEKGAKKRSGWSVAGISLLGLLLSLGIMAGIAADQPFYEGELVEADGNELYHDAQIPKSDVEKLLDKLKKADFFGTEYGNIARLESIAGDYFITLVVDEELWTEQDIIHWAEDLKQQLETEFGRKTHMKLASIPLAGETKLKYID